MDIINENILDPKLIKISKDIETYEAKMRILIKKVKAQNKEEVFLLKNKISTKKNEKKIYDIKENCEKNILYIYLDINEDINDLLFNNNDIYEKEAIMK